MTDIPISGLPNAAAIQGPELIPVVQAGTTVQTTAQNVLEGLSVVSGINISNQTVLATGANTARTLAAFLADTANVFSYGAIANGTYDNTTPFNQASNANAVYVIPQGNYYVSYIPPVSATTGTALLLGASVSGSGVLGVTDGSAIGEGPIGVPVNGVAIIRGYGDDWNQHVLVVQSTLYNNTGTTNTQKNGIYSNVVNEQVSNATGSPAYTKDAVAVAGFGNIAAGNSQGRVWGANFVASCPSGSDGQITGIEIDCNNNGPAQNDVATENSKYGLTIYNLGTNIATCGVLIGSGFAYGLTFYGCNGAFAWNVLSISGVQLSYVDTQGNLFAQSVQTQGYTVATLPAGKTGMRAYVTDATAPTFLSTLTGGGSVVSPVFYNGTAWVAG